ncbi:MAG: ABC transporter permease subunit [Acidimicrobiales bacterium]
MVAGPARIGHGEKATDGADPAPAPTATGGPVVTRLTARRAARSGVLWGYVFGILVASSAYSYSSIYKTHAQRVALERAFGSNFAASALFGPAPRLETVAGFTVFKVSMTAMIIGAVWGLLTATRLLRGEEEAGRWELLLTGRCTRRGATAQALAGLAAGACVVWALSALIIAVSGRLSRIDIGVGPALFLALALVASAVVFLAVGALTSQLAPTRRQAAAYAAVVLGASYALRMVADAGLGLQWLRWTSPLGWVEELHPLTAPHWLPLVPIAGFTVVVGVTAVHLAGVRDLGASTFPDRLAAPARLRWLGGSLGLTARLVRPSVLGWWVAIALSAMLTGFVAKAAGATIAGSSLHSVLSRLGASGAGTESYLGLSSLIIAVLVAFVAAGQVTAARGEEAAGRADTVMVEPVSRTRWFGGRLLVAAVALVASGVIAGVFTWFGTATEHTGLGFGTLLDAGLNVVPPALCVLGIGALAFGLWPRASSVVVYAVLGWGLLIEVVGGIGALSHWVFDTSVFHQMSAAPAVTPDWTTAGVLVAVGAACAALGALAFDRRDLRGE